MSVCYVTLLLGMILYYISLTMNASWILVIVTEYSSVLVCVCVCVHMYVHTCVCVCFCVCMCICTCASGKLTCLCTSVFTCECNVVVAVVVKAIRKKRIFLMYFVWRCHIRHIQKVSLLLLLLHYAQTNAWQCFQTGIVYYSVYWFFHKWTA